MKNEIINFLIEYYETLKSALDYIMENGNVSKDLKIIDFIGEDCELY